MTKKLLTLIAAMTLCIATLDVQAQNQVKSPSKAQIRRTEKKMERLTIRDSIVLEKHHSIRIGYGAAPKMFGFSLFDPAYISTQYYYRGNEQYSGIAFAEYSYRPLRWLETGLHVGYVNSTQQFFDRITDATIGHHSLNTISFAAHVRFSYLTRPIVRLYSGLAIGAAVGFEQIKIDRQIINHSRVFFNGGVTIFGITVGRRLYGFFELGYGTLGVCNFGIGYRFATK